MLIYLCKNTFRCTLLTQTNPFYVDLKASFVKVLFGKILAIYMCLFKKFAKRVFPTCLWDVFSYSRYLDILLLSLHICYISFHLLTSFYNNKFFFEIKSVFVWRSNLCHKVKGWPRFMLIYIYQLIYAEYVILPFL